MLRNWVANRFSPASLFAAGAQGLWYDPSDLASMYQDSAGTTAAAVGQPVGLVLDKRFGLALGAELKASGAAAIIGAATAATYNTTTGAGTVARVDGTNQSYVTFTGLSANTTYRLNITNTGADILGIRRGAQSGTVVASLNAAASAVVFVDMQASTQISLTYGSAAGSAAFTVNTLAQIPGNHAVQATAASRPTLSQDASGFYYLSFDGTDDSLAIAALDLTASDKLTVHAGVNKQSDAASGVVIESSVDAASTDGSFHILAPNAAATPGYAFRARGTVVSLASTSTGYAAPVANVLTATADIAGDQTVLRVNGAQVATAATDMGTGNFTSQATYIGRRTSTTVPFTGRIYGLIVRGGPFDAAAIARGEAYIASKMGIAL